MLLLSMLLCLPEVFSESTIAYLSSLQTWKEAHPDADVGERAGNTAGYCPEWVRKSEITYKQLGLPWPPQADALNPPHHDQLCSRQSILASSFEFKHRDHLSGETPTEVAVEASQCITRTCSQIGMMTCCLPKGLQYLLWRQRIAVPPEHFQAQGVPLQWQTHRKNYTFTEMQRLQGNAFAMICPIVVKIAQGQACADRIVLVTISPPGQHSVGALKSLPGSVDWRSIVERHGEDSSQMPQMGSSQKDSSQIGSFDDDKERAP